MWLWPMISWQQWALVSVAVCAMRPSGEYCSVFTSPSFSVINAIEWRLVICWKFSVWSTYLFCVHFTLFLQRFEFSFTALTLLVGWQEQHRPCKNFASAILKGFPWKLLGTWSNLQKYWLVKQKPEVAYEGVSTSNWKKLFYCCISMCHCVVFQQDRTGFIS